MSTERSSLAVEPGFNRLELRLQQRPLVAWAILSHLTVFAVFFSTAFFGLVGLAPISILIFLAGMAFFAFSLLWRRDATFSLGPSQLVVEGWTGLFARPAVHRLPLAGLRMEYTVSGSVNRRRVYRLRLTPEDGESIRVGALACSEEDLLRLAEEVAAAQADARARTGLGEGEVPAALHAVRGEARPEGA